jgi:CheY-like chemotaxis protein
MKRIEILLIEDNQLLRWCMTRSLSQEGLVVVAPSTVEEGLRLGTTFRFDLLITDWQLPDGHDGFQVLAAVRQSFPQTASILISAHVDAALIRRGVVAGFDRIIQKPLEAADITGAIQGRSAVEGARI